MVLNVSLINTLCIESCRVVFRYVSWQYDIYYSSEYVDCST
ncbi:hypothetical protein ASZ90_020208 [hydrocarbon metagenome]|uniref:Uncharacterized protein n=1 Tax=hydrocarbon metagenome TaxID=938273 RepID=A0A0W8E184_9ZZZZ